MKLMELAIKQAELAYDKNEVPIGAVIAKNGEVISCSHNLTQKNADATCHAELNAIKDACKKLGSKYLDDCDLYVTVEPCPMCAGAIINTKIKRVYIGAPEPKSGCCGSVINILETGIFNHSPEVYHGINEDKCKKLMKTFFEKTR